MIEAVGHEYMEEFFGCCESVLAQNGLLVLQVFDRLFLLYKFLCLDNRNSCYALQMKDYQQVHSFWY